MACTTCNKNEKCGCADTGLVTAPNTVNTPTCPTPNPCSETFSDQCIIHTGADIVELGVETGDNVSNILQNIAIVVTSGVECLDPSFPGASILGITVTAKTSTSLTIAWQASAIATDYSVRYRTSSLDPWTILPNTTSISSTITGLIANTGYYIQVLPVVETVSCPSATLFTKTNP